MKKLGDWWWPDYDNHCCLVVPREAERIPRYLEGLPDRNVCIQAGGNVGVYPQILSKHFYEVHTFEPDWANFECLKRNVTATNVVPHFSALGDKFGTVSAYRTDDEKNNCGATRVKEGTGAWISIGDRLGIRGVNLIMLDVEGWELPALRGLEQTIERDRPRISVELKGHGKEFGGDDEVRRWLASRGYGKTDQVGRDEIWSRLHA